MMLTMLLLLHGLLPSVEGTTSSLCDNSCADEDSPVCGTNGVTYRNFCFYMNAACNNKTLSLAVTDACPGYVAEVTNRPRLAGTTSSSSSMYSCNNTCNKDLSPVCASDGQTYTNPYRHLTQDLRGQALHRLSAVYDGARIGNQILRRHVYGRDMYQGQGVRAAALHVRL
ncbi:hypothetical protein PRIC2_006266 [Phytophthora ramorum]